MTGSKPGVRSGSHRAVVQVGRDDGVPAFLILLIYSISLMGSEAYNTIIMDSPETQSHHSWLQRFSTVEIAVVVLMVSVMGAIIWYKKIYEPRIAIIPSKSAASQVTPTATPSPVPSATPLSSDESNPFSNVYVNPFAQ